MTVYQYNEKTYTLPELRMLFPTVSFPAVPDAEELASLGVTMLHDAEPAPETLLADAKAEKVSLLTERFAHAEAFGHFGSAIGFEVDATERSNRDVSGLITMLTARGEAETLFCDYGNTMRPVTLEQLRALQLEIITYGQMLYARKWELRGKVASAETIEAVQQIEISFDDLPAPTGTTPVTGDTA